MEAFWVLVSTQIQFHHPASGAESPRKREHDAKEEQKLFAQEKQRGVQTLLRSHEEVKFALEQLGWFYAPRASCATEEGFKRLGRPGVSAPPREWAGDGEGGGCSAPFLSKMHYKCTFLNTFYEKLILEHSSQHPGVSLI